MSFISFPEEWVTGCHLSRSANSRLTSFNLSVMMTLPGIHAIKSQDLLSNPTSQRQLLYTSRRRRAPINKVSVLWLYSRLFSRYCCHSSSSSDTTPSLSASPQSSSKRERKTIWVSTADSLRNHPLCGRDVTGSHLNPLHTQRGLTLTVICQGWWNKETGRWHWCLMQRAQRDEPTTTRRAVMEFCRMKCHFSLRG
jgi:hypothetical protein